MAERLLRVRHTWSGRELPVEEQAHLQLSVTSEGLRVVVDSPWYDDPSPTCVPGLMDGLWEYEVIELFVASEAHPSEYIEIELAPTGHRLGLRFQGERRRVGAPFDVALDVRCEDGRWRGDALIDRSRLPRAPWRVNAFALNGLGENRRYLMAYRLPGDAPNFHQPAHFPAWGTLPCVAEEKR